MYLNILWAWFYIFQAEFTHVDSGKVIMCLDEQFFINAKLRQWICLYIIIFLIIPKLLIVFPMEDFSDICRLFEIINFISLHLVCFIVSRIFALLQNRKWDLHCVVFDSLWSWLIINGMVRSLRIIQGYILLNSNFMACASHIDEILNLCIMLNKERDCYSFEI